MQGMSWWREKMQSDIFNLNQNFAITAVKWQPQEVAFIFGKKKGKS